MTPELFKKIQKALKWAGLTKWETIERLINKQIMQIHYSKTKKSCLITELKQFDLKKVAYVYLGAGELEDLFTMQQDMENWGKLEGVNQIRWEGRLGWTKYMQEKGYKVHQVIMIKDI
jgi:hypothetical protein